MEENENIFDKLDDSIRDLEEATAIAQEKTKEYLVSLPKSEIKVELEKLKTDVLQYLLNSSLQTEHYEICSIAKDIIEARK